MSKLVQTTGLKQTLKMTASLQASINILQMSSLEVKALATEELSKNPFLEDEEQSEKESEDKNLPTEQISSPTIHNKTSSHDPDQDFLASIEVQTTLKGYIAEQITIEITDPVERAVAFYLLDCLQPNGYAAVDTKEISTNLKCSTLLVERVLRKLQKFDPPGIFARNLQECLLLQLKTKNYKNKAAYIIIDHLELLAKGEIAKLCKLCSVQEKELFEVITDIKSLNPKPANGFFIEETLYKIPDVILNLLPNGEFLLEINPDIIPKLKANREYYTTVKSSLRSREEKEFTRQELSAATNLIKGIENRFKTILKVAESIVEEQTDFFTRGIMFLKPLTLSRIAELTGFNESTVSRATANKYIASPSGIYELKYFFSSSLSNIIKAGSDVSSTKVKELIKQLIASEELDNILSDDEIASQLKKFNVNIARRTVAKYREALGIESSGGRKRQAVLHKK